MGVIEWPPAKHQCVPGWIVESTSEGLTFRLPTPRYPVGTVWECDDCGTLWRYQGVKRPRSGGGYAPPLMRWKQIPPWWRRLWNRYIGLYPSYTRWL